MGSSDSAHRVQQALQAMGYTYSVVELPATTRTARDAARAVGCQVAQIAKSLVFKTASGHPVLVVASGINRVDETLLAKLVGEPVEKADADFVRRHTGYAIGGVPPVGHINPLPTYIDEDLLSLGEIWAAAGTPNAVFRLDPADLPRMTGGQVVTIKA